MYLVALLGVLLRDWELITSKIIAKVLPFIMKQVWKAILPELKPLQKYVNEPNDLDLKVKRIEKKLKRLEKQIDGIYGQQKPKATT